jgi:hypothetical protein
MDDAFVVLVVAAWFSFAVNGHALLKLSEVSDATVVTFFLKVGGFDRADGDGRGNYKRRDAENQCGGDIKESSSHGWLLRLFGT